jgi:2-keto-4-pentenoate hydratase
MSHEHVWARQVMLFEDSGLVTKLYEARRIGSLVDVGDAPFGLHDALSLQLQVADAFRDAGDSVGGWKVGMTSGVSRDWMGKDFRPFGFVRQSRIFDDGATIRHGDFLNCSIEPELCLILGGPLRGPAINATSARAAVSAIAPAFELGEVRVPGGRNADHGALVADGLGQWGVVVGPLSPPKDVSGITAKLYREDELVSTSTAGKTFEIDDAFLSLARLCVLLDKHGRGLESGQVVITGSYSHATVEEPGTWRSSFSGLGTVSITLA